MPSETTVYYIFFFLFGGGWGQGFLLQGWVPLRALYLVVSVLMDLTLKGNQGCPKEGGLNIGQHEGLNMQRIEGKAPSNQLLFTTPLPWDPPGSL